MSDQISKMAVQCPSIQKPNRREREIQFVLKQYFLIQKETFLLGKIGSILFFCVFVLYAN